MTQTRTIDDAWRALKTSSDHLLHIRIDETHPLDFYAEFEKPDRPGLVLICSSKPPATDSLRAVAIEQGIRADGKWWLRLSLSAPELRAVFSALCKDIIAFTRSGTDAKAAPNAVLKRLSRWKELLDEDRGCLSVATLRGLLAELLILERSIVPASDGLEAVLAWTGPSGTAQDFTFTDGSRLEVKAVGRDAKSVTINRLDQLDDGGDHLDLSVVRFLDVGLNALGAETVGRVVARLRSRLDDQPNALAEFENKLTLAGWFEDSKHERVIVRFLSNEVYAVNEKFPRLIRSNVPDGVEGAVYSIRLPDKPDRIDIIEVPL